MQPEQLVSILVQRWRTLKNQGRVVAPEELCAGHPELLESVRRGIQAQALSHQETVNLPESQAPLASQSSDELSAAPPVSHGSTAETIDPASTLDPAPLARANDDTLGSPATPAGEVTVDSPTGPRPSVIRQRVPGY